MRIVSVWLDRWPVRRFLKAQDRTRCGAPVDPERPFVLAVEASGGPRVSGLNEAAEAEGVALGDGITDARAKARGLQVRDRDSAADAAALSRLALWATRYSPSAAPFGPAEGADGLFLDVAGAAHLFGGEADLLRDLRRRLSALGLPARVALAGTPGAAWALTHFGGKAVTLVPPGGEEAALRPLPVEALRLKPAVCSALRRLGLKRIGDVLDQPRAPLSRRFGAALVLNLDQALGRTPEPIAWIALPPAYGAAQQFIEPLTAPDAIVGIARRLFEELCPALDGDGVGARTLRLTLYRVDGETFCIDLGLAAPTRNPPYVERLFSLRFERLSGAIDPGFGFETIRLDATTVESLKPRQEALAAAGEETGADERATALADSLVQRLGPGGVRRLRPIESHTPERAVASLSGAAPRPEWPAADRETNHGDDEQHHHGRNPNDAADHHSDDHDDPPPRPSLLLPRAEPAEVMALVPDGPPRRFRWRGHVHRVVHAQGPERIAPEWWHREEPQPTRDYFLVEDESGRRFWLFCEGLYGRETAEPRWFVHGFFP